MRRSTSAPARSSRSRRPSSWSILQQQSMFTRRHPAVDERCDGGRARVHAAEIAPQLLQQRDAARHDVPKRRRRADLVVARRCRCRSTRSRSASAAAQRRSARARRRWRCGGLPASTATRTSTGCSTARRARRRRGRRCASGGARQLADEARDGGGGRHRGARARRGCSRIPSELIDEHGRGRPRASGWYVIADDDSIFAMSNSAPCSAATRPRRRGTSAATPSRRPRSTPNAPRNSAQFVCAIREADDGVRTQDQEVHGGGGAGIAISRGLAAKLAAPSTAASPTSQTHWLDERLDRCVRPLGVEVQHLGGAHQMDIEGDMLGFLECIRGSRSCRCTISTRSAAHLSKSHLRGDASR